MKKPIFILKIIFKFFLLIFPIGIGGWLILIKFNYLAHFNDLPNNEYTINSIFIVFIFTGLIPIFLNLFFYIIDFSNFGFNYNGKSKFVKYISGTAFILIVITFFIIGFFAFYIYKKLLSFNEIINYNRWVSLLIFFMFGIIDSFFLLSENIKQKSITDKLALEESNNNITLSKESIFLINIPTLIIIALSFYLANSIEHIEYFKEIINQKDFLKIITIPISDNKILSIFINGIETGIIMTSLIFSQIVFFVIKTKWDYRDFRIKIKKAEKAAGNIVCK